MSDTYFWHRVIQVRLQPSNNSSCCIFASCCLLFPFLLFILRDRKTGRKKKKRHCCSASSKTSFMGWPCSLTLVTPRISERGSWRSNTHSSPSTALAHDPREAPKELSSSLCCQKNDWLNTGSRMRDTKPGTGRDFTYWKGPGGQNNFSCKERGAKKPESKHYNRTREYIIDTQADTRTESYDIFFSPRKCLQFTPHLKCCHYWMRLKTKLT